MNQRELINMTLMEKYIAIWVRKTNRYINSMKVIEEKFIIGEYITIFNIMMMICQMKT